MTLAISDKASIPRGSFGEPIGFTILENDGTVKTLTGLTLTLLVYKVGETPIVAKACTIDDAAAGTCHYTPVEGDFDVQGEYEWSIKMTKASYEDYTEPAPFKVTYRPG